MDGTAVKQIAEMQREIDHLESDILALLSLVKGNDKQGIYWNQESLAIAEEIEKLQNK